MDDDDTIEITLRIGGLRSAGLRYIAIDKSGIVKCFVNRPILKSGDTWVCDRLENGACEHHRIMAIPTPIADTQGALCVTDAARGEFAIFGFENSPVDLWYGMTRDD